MDVPKIFTQHNLRYHLNYHYVYLINKWHVKFVKYIQEYWIYVTVYLLMLTLKLSTQTGKHWLKVSKANPLPHKNSWKCFKIKHFVLILKISESILFVTTKFYRKQRQSQFLSPQQNFKKEKDVGFRNENRSLSTP